MISDDIKEFSLPEELIEELRGSTIIITGGTGLIGSTLVRCLHHLNAGIRFILPVRNRAKCQSMFGHELDSIKIIETDLVGFFDNCALGSDYIIHCASPTSGDYITKHPVETFSLAFDSTRAMLNYARRYHPKGLVYVSSIEYYGRNDNDNPVTEDMMGQIDHSSLRSAYPLGKQAAEFLAVSYAAEYGVPVKIARPTQTFGAGIAADDQRVFAQFARSVINHNDIILHTTGESAKPYCYTTDVAAALIYILLKGKPGEAYNVATPGTYVNIRRLAELFRDGADQKINVVIDLQQTNNYAPVTKVNLDSTKLQSLGWEPRYDLPAMISRLVESLSDK